MNLSRFSKLIGCRPDLVQAGGGNTSMKLNDNTMLVKSSGVNLADVTDDCGFVTVSLSKTLELLTSSLRALNHKGQLNDQANQLLQLAKVDGDGRPSMETYLHAVLGPCVCHVHPITVNAFTCKQAGFKTLKEIFPDAIFLDYYTPGIELGFALYDEVNHYKQRFQQLPKLVFLQNHGVIVGGETFSDIFSELETINQTLANRLGFNLAKYNAITAIMQLFAELDRNYVLMLSEDLLLNDFLDKKSEILLAPPLYPDQLVYCGPRPLMLSQLDGSELVNYFNEYKIYPRVVVFNDKIYFVGKTLASAKMVEDVFNAHLQVLLLTELNCTRYLGQQECDFLLNWEAEKYRIT